MGDVYETLDTELGEAVALKTIRSQLAMDESALRRFRNEVRLARRITHPGVSRVYDLGLHDGRIPFVTMELLRGQTLAEQIESHGPIPPSQVLDIVRQLTSALGAAHSKGVIHRDLHPGNVMLVSEDKGEEPSVGSSTSRVVITDFGLAWALDAGGERSEPEPGAQRIFGTPGYLAPELRRGGIPNAQADIFALGVMIYYMVTAELPWPGDTETDLLEASLRDRPKSLREAASHIDPRWEAVVQRCLSDDPAARFLSPMDLWRAFVGGRAQGTRRVAIVGEPITSRDVAGVARLLAAALVEQCRASILDADTTRDSVRTHQEDSSAGRVGPTSPRQGTRIEAQEVLDNLQRRHGVDCLVFLRVDTESIEATMVGSDGDSAQLEESTAAPATLEASVRTLARRIARLVDPEIETARAAGGGNTPLLPERAEAVRPFLNGVESLHDHRFSQAIEFLDESLEADPTAPMTHFALAEALHALGYEAEAALSAQRAFELSVDLPRRERLRIEAKYRLLSGERAVAIDIYRSLCLFDPESVRDGLDLVDALCRVNRGGDAQAAARLLRTHALHPDLRIDLAEARAAEAATDFEASRRLAEGVRIEATQSGARSILADALLILARASSALGDLEAADTGARDAEALYRDLGNEAGRVSALHLSGMISRRRGELRLARARFQQSMELARDIGQVGGVGRALAGIGDVLVMMSDLDGAEPHLTEAVRLHREASNRADLARALRSLANLKRHQSSFADAANLFEESVELAMRDGQIEMAARSLCALSLAAMDAGDLERAKRTADTLLGLDANSIPAELRPIVHNTVAGIRGKAGDIPAAAREYEAALAARDRLAPNPDRSFDLAGLAWARLQLCELDSAWSAASEGVAILVGRDRPRDEAMLRIYLAEISAAKGDLERAIEEFDIVDALSASSGDEWTALSARLSRGNVYVGLGRHAEVAPLVADWRGESVRQSRPDAEVATRIIEARALCELGRAEDAETALSHAKLLLSKQLDQNRFYRLHLSIVEGSTQFALGRSAEGTRLLEESIRDARAGGLVLLELQARLELGRSELRVGIPGGRSRLEALSQEARVRGAFGIASGAERAL